VQNVAFTFEPAVEEDDTAFHLVDNKAKTRQTGARQQGVYRLFLLLLPSFPFLTRWLGSFCSKTPAIRSSERVVAVLSNETIKPSIAVDAAVLVAVVVVRAQDGGAVASRTSRGVTTTRYQPGGQHGIMVT